jgi:hypothetical protein
MSKLKLFIKKIDKYELASLYKYRFNSFMPNSKKMILDELALRNKREDNINSYLKKRTTELQVDIENGKICPQCLSNEFYNSAEIENITFQYETHEYTKNYKTCLVCLYSQDKIDHKTERNKGGSNIFSFLKFLKSNRN